MLISDLLDQIDIPRSENVYYPAEDSYLLLDHLDATEFEKQTIDWLLKNLTDKKEFHIKILDMGCGTGIQGFCFTYKLMDIFRSVKESEFLGNRVIASKITIETTFVDINESALESAKQLVELNYPEIFDSNIENNMNIQVNFRFIHSDLFTNISKDIQFDFVIFNPPYLPNEPELINENSYKPIDLAWDGRDESGNKVILKFFDDLKNFTLINSSIFFISSSHANIEQLLKNLDEKGFYIILLQSIHIFFEDIHLFLAVRNA